jgi:hypothetical protein
MSETALDATNSLLRRARDPGGLATTVDEAMSLLSRSQQLLNLGLQAVIDETVLATVPSQQLYALSAVPRAGRVIAIREAGRDLSTTAWSTLRHTNRAWSRAVGDRFELWAPLGWTHVIIYPAKLYAAEVTVVSLRLIEPIASGSVNLVIPDELTPPLYDIAEALLALKMRKLSVLLDLRNRATERVKALRRGAAA